MTRTPQDPAASARAPVAAQGAALPGGPVTPLPPGVAGGRMSGQAQAPKLPAPGRTPDPETRLPGPAEVRVRARTPAGASASDSPPAGSTPSAEAAEAVPGGSPEPGRGTGGKPRPGQGNALRGKAAMDAVRAEQSRQAKAARVKRGRYPAKARRGAAAVSGPGMMRRMPPPQTPGGDE